MSALTFEYQQPELNSLARAGKITTSHGVIETPVFMPVGTAGSVKAITQQQLIEDIGAEIILGNTYHLYLRPGIDVIEKAGGLHKFIGFNKPMLTDSGGYQVFSLSGSRKINEDGVIFQSHIDGSKHVFTPEKVIDIQRSIGADIIMAFDECPPGGCDFNYAQKSMQLTHRWLKRCFNNFNQTSEKYGFTQNLFPIVQGGTFNNLRVESCQTVSEYNAVGNAIGGLSVGEPEEIMYEMCNICCQNLPANKPRYLMGVGTPWNILNCIALGVDMFDCVMPTRNGRNAMLFTTQGIINIDNKKWENDFSAIDDVLDCTASKNYSKSYLRHLIKSKEFLGFTIASMQNLALYNWLVKESRKKILEGTFMPWKNEMVIKLSTRL